MEVMVFGKNNNINSRFSSGDKELLSVTVAVKPDIQCGCEPVRLTIIKCPNLTPRQPTIDQVNILKY